MLEIKFKPIGMVKVLDEDNKISKIIIFRDFVDGLRGLDEYSHLYIIYYFHLNEGKGYSLLVHPMGRRDLPLAGVFATRSPYRPNLVGLSIVELLRLDNDGLLVKNLDALDGTPVLDIKPVIERVEVLKLPEWIR